MAKPNGARTPAQDMWLLLVSLIAFAIIFLSGLSQLDHSGPSITTWGAITQIVPPISYYRWHQILDRYRENSQFLIDHANLSLFRFQFLYGIEWLRIFASSALDFAIVLGVVHNAGQPHQERWPRMLWVSLLTIAAVRTAFIWVLLPGEIGRRPDLAGISLTVRSGSAAMIAMICLWQRTKRQSGSLTQPRPIKVGWLPEALALSSLIVYFTGTLATGSKAGAIFSYTPGTAGSMISNNILLYSPWWKNIFLNPVTIYMLHFISSLSMLLMSVSFILRPNEKRQSKIGRMALFLIILQCLIGVGEEAFGGGVVPKLLHLLLAMALLYVVCLLPTLDGTPGDEPA